MGDIVIHFPPGEYYACTDCGKCCSAPWRIQVGRDEADEIRKLELHKKLRREGYQPLKVYEEAFELDRRENLDCFYLENGRCGLHNENGPLAKPSVCQLYPFSLVATPDGYYVSMMFTCPAVIAGAGPAVQTHNEGLIETIEHAPHYFPPGLVPGDTITMVTGVKHQWSDYRKFEDEIFQSLGHHDDLSRVILMIAAAAIVSGTDGKPPTLNPEDPTLMKATFDQLSDLLSLFVIHAIASFEERDEPDKRAAYAEKLSGDLPLHSNVMNCEVAPYKRGRFADHLTRVVLKRYVFHKFWGKSLITGPTFTIRLLLLVVCLEAFHHYLEGLKMSTSTLHFDQDLLERCFDFIETDFMVHDELLLPLIEEWERISTSYCNDLYKELFSP